MKYLPTVLAGALLCCGFAGTPLLAQHTSAERPGVSDLQYAFDVADLPVQTGAGATAAPAEATPPTGYTFATDAERTTGEYFSAEPADAPFLRRLAHLRVDTSYAGSRTLTERLRVESAAARTRALGDLPTRGEGLDPR